jgi:hypothetical protein
VAFSEEAIHGFYEIYESMMPRVGITDVEGGVFGEEVTQVCGGGDRIPRFVSLQLTSGESSLPAHISPPKFYPLCHSEMIKIHQLCRKLNSDDDKIPV